MRSSEFRRTIRMMNSLMFVVLCVAPPSTAMSQTAATPQSAGAPVTATVPPPPRPDAPIPDLSGFIDGNIEELGKSYIVRQKRFSVTTGDPGMNAFLRDAQKQNNVIAIYWHTTGHVTLAITPGNTALKLDDTEGRGATVAQTILLPDHTQSLEFDLGVQKASPGDRFNVLLNGIVFESIELTTAPVSSHESIPLSKAIGSTGKYTTTGTFTFQLAGSGSKSAVITLDNFAIGSTANHAPVVLHQPMQMPSISNTITDAANTGIAVASLQVDLSDADPSDVRRLGIAIVGVDSTDGTLQFSRDGGRKWSNVGAVSDAVAFVITPDPENRLRFVPDRNFAGSIKRAFSFRAWDQTTGINALDIEYIAANVYGGTSAFSAEEDSVSLTVERGADDHAVQSSPNSTSKLVP